MRGMFRALVLFRSLTFAAGTVAHAGQAADMAVEMTMTADGAMPGCDGCGGSDDNDTAGKVGCSLTCVTPVVAILDADGATAVAAGSVVDGLPERHPVGCITPVDPSPPQIGRAHV